MHARLQKLMKECSARTHKALYREKKVWGVVMNVPNMPYAHLLMDRRRKLDAYRCCLLNKGVRDV